MDSVAFVILGFSITWYALFIMIGIILSMLIIYKELDNYNLNKEEFLDIAYYTIIFGFVGARVWYVLFNFSYYSSDILQIFAVWNGGLAIHGGLVGGLLYFLYKFKGKKLLIYLDLTTMVLFLGQAIGRWGNFFNQEAHGGITTYEFLSETLRLPEFIVQGMHISGQYYHPTFLYESVINFIGFLIAYFILRKIFRDIHGLIFSFYLMWYGLLRFLIETIRTDALMFFDLKIARVTSLSMFIVGMVFLILIIKKERDEKNRN